MRHVGFVSCVALLLLTAGLQTAVAGNAPIVLTSDNQSIVFQGTGSSNSLQLVLGGCSSGSCTAMSGGGITNDSVTNQQYLGNYSMTVNSPSDAFTLTAQGGGNYSVSGPAIVFQYSDGHNSLAGNLNLTTFSQTGAGGSFNNSLSANLQITNSGGDFATMFGPNGSYGALEVNIAFGSSTDLSTLFNNQNSITANFSSGQVDTTPSPTPEPASMALFGSGLLLAGITMRRLKARMQQ